MRHDKKMKMLKNSMRPLHPGEVLREDYLKPLDMSANALARQLHVPASRINDIVLERRGITAAPRRFAWNPTRQSKPEPDPHRQVKGH